MAKSVLDALKATGCADLTAAIEAVSANMFKIKEGPHGNPWDADWMVKLFEHRDF